MPEKKLYPPDVEPSVPAQLVPDASASETTTTLLVPFQLNKAVSWADLGDPKRISLILKTVSTGKIILDGFQGQVAFDKNSKQQTAKFEIPNNKFTPIAGQHYKLQIAFISSTGVIGYYSDVTVVKFTSIPKLSISDMGPGINGAKYSYTGLFESKDISEKVFYYEFNIYDSETGLLHDTSGKMLHNSSSDTERDKSSDTWTSYKTLVNERQYKIVYKITTINGLEFETPAYTVMSLESLDLVSKNTEFIATLYSDDAYVHIHILPKDLDAEIRAITGNFILVRASSEDGFSSWREIYKFTLANNYPMMTLWKDFTVQQGYSYKYAVQAYNSKGVYSNRLECKYYACEQDEREDDITRQLWNAEPVDPMENTNLTWHYLQNIDGTPTSNGLPVDFEDAFLYDGERQLKIRYNPKISSFKTTTLEAKIDTIGGKYPFIFRNGNVEYSEFPISGLITMLMDDNALFVEQDRDELLKRRHTICPPYTKEDSNWNDIVNTSKYESRERQMQGVSGSRSALTAENFRREREFKMEVLKWLNNGQPKLFRSPSEGNFIIRLMNVTLSPNDTLGRMLHTFNCTAYEIADCNFTNLSKFKFINALETSYQEMKFKMVDAYSTFSRRQNHQIIIDDGAYYMAIIDQYGHWALRVTYLDGTSTIINAGNVTGQYLFEKEALKNNPIVSITYMDGAPDVGAKILYGFYEITEASFSLISHITREAVVDQIVGHPEIGNRIDSFDINYIDTILNGIGYKDKKVQRVYGYDTIPRQSIGKFYYLKAEPRQITKIFLSNGKYYLNQKCDHEVYEWDDTAIYAVYALKNDSWRKTTQYSGRPSNGVVLENPNYQLKINANPNNGSGIRQEEVVDLSLRGGAIGGPITTGRYELYFDLDQVENLNIGSGLVCEICYNLNTIFYEAEEKAQYVELGNKKKAWKKQSDEYTALLQNGVSAYSAEAEDKRRIMELAYHNYLSQLKVIIENLQKEGDTYYAL